MSVHVLLNLLNELRKGDKCEACQAFNRYIVTRLIKEHICMSYDTKKSLKSHFWLKMKKNSMPTPPKIF